MAQSVRWNYASGPESTKRARPGLISREDECVCMSVLDAEVPDMLNVKIRLRIKKEPQLNLVCRH